MPSTVIEPPKTKPRLPGGGVGGGNATPVIVLNDDHNTFEGVASSLSQVLPSCTFERGMELANRVHNSGSAVVWSGQLEVAELYHEQLSARGLTMEPLGRG